VNELSEEIECPFKDKCTDRPNKCPNCGHNTGKRSHYKPPEPYYTPPNEPCWWPYPIWPPEGTTWLHPYYRKRNWIWC